MRINESGRHQLAAGVDLAVEGSIEVGTDMDDAVILEDDDSIWNRRRRLHFE